MAYGALAVSLTVVAEKFTNMLCQPFTGRLSDSYGRAAFVFVGGGLYGLIAHAAPFSPAIGATLALPESYPLVGALSPAFLPLVVLSGLLGVASSFGIRELVWRPGSVIAPLLGDGS